MKNPLFLVPLLCALLWQSSARAATQSELDAISTMGELNGIALQCRYIEQMRRIKLSLVMHLPKQRELGDWFEHTTNNSFMDFMRKDAQCPTLQQFDEQLDAAIKEIAVTFKQ